MASSKNSKINVWRRARRLYLRRRDRARERRKLAEKAGDAVGAKRALRVLRRYTDKAQGALVHIRALRKQDEQHGKVIVLSYANRPGHPITAIAMQFFQAVAEEGNRTMTCNCGTNHSKYTTSGSVSDHYDGHAGDFGISWNNGDAVASAALRTCGWSKQAAANAASRGGLYNVSWKGHRIQVIWKTYIGGNHYNHVHLGCR